MNVVMENKKGFNDRLHKREVILHMVMFTPGVLPSSNIYFHRTSFLAMVHCNIFSNEDRHFKK